jgi:hypothetical protein
MCYSGLAYYSTCYKIGVDQRVFSRDSWQKHAAPEIAPILALGHGIDARVYAPHQGDDDLKLSRRDEWIRACGLSHPDA